MKLQNFFIVIFLSLIIASCTPKSNDTIYQTEPLQKLLEGDYSDGQTSLGELKKLGDYGIGTFDGYQGGEMLILEGLIYSIPYPKKSILIKDLSLKTPFAMITKFTPEQRIQMNRVNNLETLEKFMDEHFNPEKSYAILITGYFRSLKVQTVITPQEVGLPFDQIGQEKAELRDTSAELFGFKMGSKSSDINHVGYHFHGRTQSGEGGHILDLKSTKPITIQWQEAKEVVVLHK